MSRGSLGTYASLASALSQGDGIAAPARGEYSPPINMTVLPATMLNEAPAEPLRRRSSRPQISSPLLNSVSPPENPPRNYSEDSSTQAQGPSRSHSQEPFVTGNSYPSLPLDFSGDQRRSLHPQFNSKTQFKELFGRGLIRFMITLGLVILFMVTVKVFSDYQVLSRKKKLWFNAIITGLSMTLGMSFAEAFKRMAIDIRWWILSRKKRKLFEVDKILRADSLTVLGTLCLTYLRRNYLSRHLFRDWGLILGIAIWLLVNVSAQVAIASVALTYSPEVQGSIAQTTEGLVLLPNMTQIFPLGTQAHDSIGAQQFTANSFGNVALALPFSVSASYIPSPGKLWSTINAAFFLSNDGKSWTFVFIDSSPSDPGYADNLGGPSAMFTDRTISSTYSCLSFPVIRGGNGTAANLAVQQDSNGDLSNVSLPAVASLDTTMYFTNPDASCGDGCSIIEAFEASYTTSWYYQCNITVGAVSNATVPQHEVGINLREMASAGIALQGYGPNHNLPGSKQFQVYPSASPYGVQQNGYSDGMGWQVSRFAIGVVSVAALYTNHTLKVTGLQPNVGNQLIVNHWPRIWLIMGLIVGVQGAAFVLTAFWANRVVVKDENVFATARLLRPIVDKLGDEGTMTKGKDICKLLDAGEERRFIYAVPKGRDEQHQAELGDWPRSRTFPEGVYK